jgi:[acyl-carrier-protein] S-malonyltransferase
MAGFSRFTSVTTAIDHQYKILFPGQGTQYVGMTKTLSHRLPPSIDAVFRTADSVFGFDIRKMCLEGPQGALNQTIHCQPAVVVTSLAAYEAIKLENPLVEL